MGRFARTLPVWVVSVCGLLCTAEQSRAQILWSSSVGSAWLTGGNWTGGAVPTGAQIAQFGANPTSGATGVGINFNSTTNAGTQTNGQRIQEVGAVEMTAARAATFLIGNSSGAAGATGQFRLNGVTVNGEANTIIRNNSAQQFTIQNTQGNGSLTMSLVLGNVTNNVVNIDGTGNVVISSVITGTGGGLSLNGSSTGILILSGGNTYTGGTTVNSGTLQVGDAGTTGTLGSGAVTNNGTLQFNRTGVTAVANAISGSGALRAMSSVTLTATNTYSGVSTVDAGSTLQIGSGGTVGSIGTGTVANGGTLTFNRTNALAVANSISGGGAVTQAGPGVTTLSGTNTYSGVTTVTAGTLHFNTTGSLYNGNSGDWNTTNIVVNSDAILGLTLGGANGFSSSQVQTINQLGTLTGGLKVGAYLGIDTRNGDQTHANVIANSNGGANQIGFAKLGANTLTLTADNTYSLTSNGTRVFEGTLQVGDGGTTGRLGSGTVSLGSGTTLAFKRSDNIDITNGISGTGGLSQRGDGIVTLIGTKNYFGPTSVNAGTLKLSSDGAINNTPTIFVASGATYDVSAVTAGYTLGSGPAQELFGTGTVTGGVTVAANSSIFGGNGTGTGTLTTGNVTVLSGGRLGVQLGTGTAASQLNTSAGILNLNSGAILDPNGGFATPGDRVLATLGGSSSSLVVNGANVNAGDEIATYTYATGDTGLKPFGVLQLDVTGLNMSAGEKLVLSRDNTNQLVLSFTPVPEPGLMLVVCGLAVGGVVAVRKLRRKAMPAEVTHAA